MGRAVCELGKGGGGHSLQLINVHLETGTKAVREPGAGSARHDTAYTLHWPSTARFGVHNQQGGNAPARLSHPPQTTPSELS
jgi:hypothetical protein